MLPHSFAIRIVMASALLCVGTISHTSASEPAKEDVELWWADLQKGDAEASRALLKLASVPAQTVSFLKQNMKPLKLDVERLKLLIGRLGSDMEDARKSAIEEFQYFDPRLAIDLETLMKEVQQAPARQRLVEVLCGHAVGALEGKEIKLRSIGPDGFNFTSDSSSWWAEHKIERINSSGWMMTKPKWTRAVRAIAILEHIGTPDAIAILEEMATGHPDAQPTKAATEALKRIAAKR